MPRGLLIRDSELRDSIIEERKRRGTDLYDEVWEGMYVMPSLPTVAHQKIVDDLGGILSEVVKRGGLGEKYPGLNISDRRKQWKDNYRIPDLVVVLNHSKAVNCGTHLLGRPDFLAEVESPGEDTEDKVPFYSQIGARELLIIHRDKRTLRLLRHDGQELILVKPSTFAGKEWLLSSVLPLTFRRTLTRGVPGTRARRTDGQPGQWTV
jgi:Uma2 family endonuclease